LERTAADVTRKAAREGKVRVLTDREGQVSVSVPERALERLGRRVAAKRRRR